jgi:hypothetical protein
MAEEKKKILPCMHCDRACVTSYYDTMRYSLCPECKLKQQEQNKRCARCKKPWDTQAGKGNECTECAATCMLCHETPVKNPGVCEKCLAGKIASGKRGVKYALGLHRI